MYNNRDKFEKVKMYIGSCSIFLANTQTTNIDKKIVDAVTTTASIFNGEEGMAPKSISLCQIYR